MRIKKILCEEYDKNYNLYDIVAFESSKKAKIYGYLINAENRKSKNHYY